MKTYVAVNVAHELTERQRNILDIIKENVAVNRNRQWRDYVNEYVNMVLKILLEIFLFLLVVAVAYIVVVFIVCKDITGTWNGFRFLFDYKYWSFAILNHKYNISLDREEDYSKFAVYFSKKQLMPRTKGVVQRMREKERKILVMLLSQEDFVKENFGKLPYTADRHSEICRNWDEHLKQRPYGEE